jgi:nucleotide-binding universal stress UspA family protein
VEDRLSGATDQGETAELTRRQVQSDDELAVILAAAGDHDLIAIGASPPDPTQPFSLGQLQDQIIHHAPADVLVTINDQRQVSSAGRILVAVNGFAHSLAAGDVAAYLAKDMDAELVLFTSVRERMDGIFWHDRGHRRLLQSGYQLLHELGFRVGRLGVRTSEHVEISEDPGAAILHELVRQPYDLVVLGAVDRSTDDTLYIGTPIETVLMHGHTPAVVVVTHDT